MSRHLVQWRRREPRGPKGPRSEAVGPDEFAREMRLIVEACVQCGLDDRKPLLERAFGLLNGDQHVEVVQACAGLAPKPAR